MAPPFLFGQPNYGVHYQFPEQLIYNRDADMRPYTTTNAMADFAAEVAAKGIYQWLFFIYPALTLTLIGALPTWRASRSRLLIYTLAFTCLGFISASGLQAHYFAVNTGILYLILLNGLRWMRVLGRCKLNMAQIRARHDCVDPHHVCAASHPCSHGRISHLGHLDEPGGSDSCMARHSPHHGSKARETAHHCPLPISSFMAERSDLQRL